MWESTVLISGFQPGEKKNVLPQGTLIFTRWDPFYIFVEFLDFMFVSNLLIYCVAGITTTTVYPVISHSPRGFQFAWLCLGGYLYLRAILVSIATCLHFAAHHASRCTSVLFAFNHFSSSLPSLSGLDPNISTRKPSITPPDDWKKVGLHLPSSFLRPSFHKSYRTAGNICSVNHLLRLVFKKLAAPLTAAGTIGFSWIGGIHQASRNLRGKKTLVHFNLSPGRLFCHFSLFFFYRFSFLLKFAL